MTDKNALSESVIFPKGTEVPGDHFTGRAWVEMIVDYDETLQAPVGNVTFEPGARNHWHKHPGGQVLMVTGGKGYYQEEGKPAQVLGGGDIVKIQPNVKHWHGAAQDSWFVHLALSTNVHQGETEWLEPVTDEEYQEAE